jgi:hypothetical protein
MKNETLKGDESNKVNRNVVSVNRSFNQIIYRIPPDIVLQKVNDRKKYFTKLKISSKNKSRKKQKLSYQK